MQLQNKSCRCRIVLRRNLHDSDTNEATQASFARYNACNQPVYFVRVRGDDDYERRGKDKHKDAYRGYEDDRGKRHDDDDKHDKGHRKGHGKGHDKG